MNGFPYYQNLGLIAFGYAIPSPNSNQTEIRLACDMFMFRANLDLKLIFLEGRISSITGFQPQELVDKTLYQLVHVVDSLALRRSHETLLIKGQVTTPYYRLLTKQKGWVWMQSYATIVQNTRSSRPNCVVSVNYLLSGVEHRDSSFTMEQLNLDNAQTLSDKSGITIDSDRSASRSTNYRQAALHSQECSMEGPPTKRERRFIPVISTTMGIPPQLPRTASHESVSHIHGYAQCSHESSCATSHYRSPGYYSSYSLHDPIAGKESAAVVADSTSSPCQSMWPRLCTSPVHQDENHVDAWHTCTSLQRNALIHEQRYEPCTHSPDSIVEASRKIPSYLGLISRTLPESGQSRETHAALHPNTQHFHQIDSEYAHKSVHLIHNVGRNEAKQSHLIRRIQPESYESHTVHSPSSGVSSSCYSTSTSPTVEHEYVPTPSSTSLLVPMPTSCSDDSLHLAENTLPSHRPVFPQEMSTPVSGKRILRSFSHSLDAPKQSRVSF
ncbi:unnamed protein product [Dicrocoelium dendriticum]|nr:unnamed protein product [Dicrocoelium dendriticum]